MRFAVPLTLLHAFVAAQTPNYFPLQTGNQWVYQSSDRLRPTSRVAEVTGEFLYEPTGVTYYTLEATGSPTVRIRQTPEGRLISLNTATGAETVLADFAAPEGAVFETALDACTTSAQIKSANAPYTGPAGTFTYALEITYTGRCADAGIQRDLFLPDVGLLQRTETTIAGPRVWDLVYARIGGVLQVAGPQVSFGIALDRMAAKPGEPLMVRLSLRNTQPDPLVLEFLNGQKFDVVLLTEIGREAYRWSAGKVFIQVVESVVVRGEKNWTADLALPADLPPGRYLVQGYLNTVPRRFTATVSLDLSR